MEEERIFFLKKQGYAPVYSWKAEPNEEDEEHEHVFDTFLSILEGELFLRVGGDETLLKSGMEILIPRNIIHYAKAGQRGCHYVIGEKH